MRKTLIMDGETREMRLVYEDFWDGQHERTEYRVTSERDGGHVVRNMPELDGATVYGTAPSLYLKGAHGQATAYVWTEHVAVGLTAKTPCPRASNARRKCALCAALAA